MTILKNIDPNEVYNLQEDKKRLEIIRSYTGYLDIKTESLKNHILLPGTKEWFRAFEENKISYKVLRGKIKEVYMSGHNDFPEVSVESETETTIWMRLGKDKEYIKNRNIEIYYVELPVKRKENGLLIKRVRYVVKIRIFD